MKDPKFEIDRLETYSLSLFIGVKDFQILVADKESSRVLLLEDYAFDPAIDDEERYNTLRFIFEDHHLLTANFWMSIRIFLKNRQFSLVPEEFFEESMSATYLSINAPFDSSQDSLMLNFHEGFGLVNIFSVPTRITNMMSEIYPGRKIRYIHQCSCLIDGSYLKKGAAGKNFTVYIDRFGMHIILLEDGQLLFYNQYVIKQFGEYMKYIQLVAGEFEFDFANDPINLYGYLGKNTPHFAELKKSIHNLTMGSRPERLKYGYVFDEISDHQYFDVFSAEHTLV